MNKKELIAALTEATKIVDCRSRIKAMRDALLWSDGTRSWMVCARVGIDHQVEVGAWFDLGPCADPPRCMVFSPREALHAVKLTDAVVTVSDLHLAHGDAEPLVYMLGPVIQARQITAREYNTAPLRHLMAHAAYAMSCDVTRSQFCAAHLTDDGDGLTIRTTDGHRLVRSTWCKDASLDLPVSRGERSILIPASGLLAIQRLIGRRVPRMIFGVNAGSQYLRTTVGAVTIVVRVNAYQSALPVYDNVIPRETQFSVTVSRVALAEALTAILPTTGKLRVCVVTVWNGKLTLDDINGTNKHTLVVSKFVSALQEPFKIGVSARYLLDALEPLKAQEVTISMTDTLDPIKITDLLSGAVAVIMPCRI